MSNPVFLGLDEVLEIHGDQIERYGGSPGIRDMELLQSAVAMAAAGIGEEYFHTDIFEMAAAYLFHIVRNYPFVDGNKRTGAVAAVVFFLMNGMELEVDEDSFEKMVRSMAEGKMDKVGIAEFFSNQVQVKKK